MMGTYFYSGYTTGYHNNIIDYSNLGHKYGILLAKNHNFDGPSNELIVAETDVTEFTSTNVNLLQNVVGFSGDYGVQYSPVNLLYNSLEMKSLATFEMEFQSNTLNEKSTSGVSYNMGAAWITLYYEIGTSRVSQLIELEINSNGSPCSIADYNSDFLYSSF